MAVKSDREYRSMPVMETREAENDNTYTVEGYASTFEPYVLFHEDGIDYKEQIDRNAFDNCDMSDVLFLYNHEGNVLARQKNGTMVLSVDDGGLKVRADLSSTSKSREMFEEIKTGLVDQMSFAFTVNEDSYDRESHTRTIRSIRKLYDVSAVSIPANPTTSISARDWVNGVIDLERAERLAEQKRKEQITRIRKLMEDSKHEH